MTSICELKFLYADSHNDDNNNIVYLYGSDLFKFKKSQNFETAQKL